VVTQRWWLTSTDADATHCSPGWWHGRAVV